MVQFGCPEVQFGSPDLWTGALGVKKVRGTVSPYSRAEIQPKKVHFSQNRKNKLLSPPLPLKLVARFYWPV